MNWRILGLGALACAGYRLLKRNSFQANGANAAYSDKQPHNSYRDVRDAGPEAMRDPCLREWTETDEDLDESFPASDPPGGY